MATLRETRTRITSVRNTSKITQAMRMVAAAKLRRAEEAMRSARPYATQLQKILRNLAAAESDFVHPLFEERKTISSVLLIIVSSDRGLCGAFNTNLLRTATHRIALLRKENPDVKVTVIPVGRRAVGSLKRAKESILAEFPDVFLKLEYPTATTLTEIATDNFLSGKSDRVEVIHNEYVSVIRQEVKVLQLLPIVPTAMQDAEKSTQRVDYIFEPSRAFLDAILPQYLNAQVWRTLLDSNAAEQASRMMAMENATKNARDLITSLQLMYNRVRQATITKEMLEIVGGAEALSKR